MLEISVEKYTNAKVHTITISNRRLFWVKICDVQKKLGVENIYDLLRKQGNIKDMKKNWIVILILILYMLAAMLF